MVRAFLDGAFENVLTLAAKHCFWQVVQDDMVKIALHKGYTVPNGSCLFYICLLLVMKLLGMNKVRALDIVHTRLAGMPTEGDRQVTALLEIDEAAQVLSFLLWCVPVPPPPILSSSKGSWSEGPGRTVPTM